MRKQTKRWPSNITERSSSCAMPCRAVGAGEPLPTCRTQWLWWRTWGLAAKPMLPWVGALPSGLAARDPRDISPCIVLARCRSWRPGWERHPCSPAWWHTWCGGAVAQPACPALLGHRGLQKCRNTSLKKADVVWWHNKLSGTILCCIFP